MLQPVESTMALAGVSGHWSAVSGTPSPSVSNALAVTVTVNKQTLVLPDVSVAVQFTVVTPSGKLAPESGAQLTVTPPQLSLAVGCG